MKTGGWRKFPAKSKYKNIKCEYNGIKFDSKKEMEFYKKLLMEQRYGDVVEIEAHCSYPYTITYSAMGRTYSKQAKYIDDFTVKYRDGTIIVYDVKGARTNEYKQKKKIIKELYNIDIVEV